MSPGRPAGRRPVAPGWTGGPSARAAGLLASLAVLAAPGWVASGGSPPPDRRPNLVVVITDDQPWWTVPHDPPVMPWLQERLLDPEDHWVRFPNAFANVPVCCPSRASLLTGRYAHRTGVRTNGDGERLDDRGTLAVWLRDAGYRTGYAGKYLNGYPFGPAPFVPPGWDRWTAKWQGSGATVYYDHLLVEDGLSVPHGSADGDYLTDVLAERAVGFVREAPPDRPFLLVFAPTAPHPPWTPARRHAGAFDGSAFGDPPSFDEADVTDKPRWVRRLPPVDAPTLHAARLDAAASLLAVDEALRRIVDAIRARGDLDRTAILVTSDNGASFGEHRWTGKSCPYDECTRVPFLLRVPDAAPGTRDGLVSLVDVAPTLADLAGLEPPAGLDGRSLLPLIEDPGTTWREGVLMEWFGNRFIPPWWAVRTTDALYVRYRGGERERYDLVRDPWALTNLAGEGGWRPLAGLLRRLRG